MNLEVGNKSSKPAVFGSKHGEMAALDIRWFWLNQWRSGKTTSLARRAIEHDWFLFIDPITHILAASSSLNMVIDWIYK